MNNFKTRINKIEDKLFPKVKTITYRVRKDILSERELNALRKRGSVEETDEFILITYDCLEK